MAVAIPPQPAPDATRVMTLYGQTMTRTGSVYAVGMMAIIPFGLISLAVSTRYLGPADYGHLSVFFAIASVITVFCGIGFSQGTLMAAYGMVDGDGEDVEATNDLALTDPASGQPALKSDERRRLLGSGLLIVLATSTILCGAIALVGGLGTHFILASHWATSILWMTASAWAGALWRIVHQVPRMERKPGRWAVLQLIRPALVVIGTVAALMNGLGINGVLSATALGTLAATAIAFFVSRRCFRFALQQSDVATLWEKGRSWVPLTIAGAIQSNANVLLLGILASPTSVGLFQVANRIAQFPIYFADGFLTGWPTMEMSPISIAAKNRKGTRQYSAAVFTLFFLSTLGLLLVVILFSDVLVHIAAPSYNSAASLIPVVAAAYGAQAVFRGLYRATAFPMRRYWFTLLHLIWIAPYAGIAALLIPLNPSYGVALAQLGAGLTVSACFVVLDRLGSEPTPFQWKRLGGALFIACGCVLIVNLLPASTAFHLMLSIGAAAAFPILLLATRTVSRKQIQIVKAIVAAVAPRRLSRANIKRRFDLLPENERQAILLVACERRQPHAAALSLDVAPDIVLARLVRGLRHFADGGPPTPIDHLIGEYVLHSGTTIERDAWAAHLRAVGVDPLQLHVLDEAIRKVSKIGRQGQRRRNLLAARLSKVHSI